MNVERNIHNAIARKKGPKMHDFMRSTRALIADLNVIQKIPETYIIRVFHLFIIFPTLIIRAMNSVVIIYMPLKNVFFLVIHVNMYM